MSHRDASNKETSSQPSGVSRQPAIVHDNLSSLMSGRHGLHPGSNRAPPKKLSIRPLRNAPRMPENFLANTWSEIFLPAVRAVHEEVKIPVSLELLYAKVEDACMHNYAPQLYTELSRVCDNQVCCLVSSLKGRHIEADTFLDLVDDVWRRHCAQMLRIRALFLKLDRTYLAQAFIKDIRSLWGMGLHQYRSHFVSCGDIERKTVDALLREVNRDRDGDTIDHARLQSLLRMFSAIGIYEESFERALLVASGDYYKTESERLIFQMNVPSYLRHVEIRLQEEFDRSIAYYSCSTKKPLVSIVEQRLLSDHIAVLLEKGFDSMCDERRNDDLRRCYLLFARANQHTREGESTAHEAMRAHFITYVKRVGLGIVMDQEKDNEMVQTLLDLKARFDEVVTHVFGRSDMFASAMIYSFASFINARENKPAELIAKFLDSILRTGNKAFSEEELELTLDRVFALFRYIDGKDVFEAFYKKDLSKRLLYDKSASHDLEKMVISKLKTECGSQFTSKLEAMFRDVDASKDLMASFRQHGRIESLEGVGDSCRSTDPVELNVFVLEAARWPMTAQRGEIKLPKELIEYQDSYKKYYLSKHEGRKLTWQHFDCSCVVKAYFPKGTKILSLSLYQTVVLVLFNNANEMSYTDILGSTGVEDTELRRTMLSLACGKVRVLQKHPKGPSIEDADVFSYNESFTNRQTRIKVNAIQMKETIEENTGTTEKVFQERSYQIDASIVRIMKTRKSLMHSALISEVYNQLRFPYKTADIKKRIESLIEREYIERDSHDPQKYAYVA